MIQYLAGFFLTYLVSVAVFVGMIMIAFVNWLFSSSPIWFNVLCVIAVTLPFLVGGGLTGCRLKSGMEKPLRGFLIILAAMLLLGMLCVSRIGEPLVLACPGVLAGGALSEITGGRDEEVFTLVGQLLFTLLFHLGWRIGRKEID